MYDIKKPEKVWFFSGYTIMKFKSYFNITIYRKKRDQVSTNQQIEKIRSRTVSITFGPHHVTRTTACFLTLGFFTQRIQI